MIDSQCDILTSIGLFSCPNKAAYGRRDLERRTAKYFNIPFNMKADPFQLMGVVGSLQVLFYLHHLLLPLLLTLLLLLVKILCPNSASDQARFFVIGR